jgi:hypothetical protein
LPIRFAVLFSPVSQAWESMNDNYLVLILSWFARGRFVKQKRRQRRGLR